MAYEPIIGSWKNASEKIARQLRLKFVFHHAGLEHREHPPECHIGGVYGPSQEHHFGWALHGRQPAHERGQPLVAVRADISESAFGPAAGRNTRTLGQPPMLVAVEPDALALTHKQVKARRQVGQRTFTISEIPSAYSLVSLSPLGVASCSLS